MSNIVGLRGGTIRPPGEVNPEVVELAERLLEMARGGEIHTLVAVYIHADETVGSQQRGTGNYRLIGLMTKIINDICADL